MTTTIDAIPVSIGQRIFEDSGLDFGIASDFLYGRRDSTRLKRDLGIKMHHNSANLRTEIDYDLAVRMVKAWNLDPIDYGI